MMAFDPDLDTATYPTASSLGDPAPYQRMIANPLLAAVALLGVWALFRYALEIRNLALFLATVFAAVVCPMLIQYHCLDCGRTDFALRSRRHVCVAVAHRRRIDDDSSWAPALRSQVKGWVIASVLAGIVYAIFRYHS